jgi:hypothetical protein
MCDKMRRNVTYGEHMFTTRQPAEAPFLTVTVEVLKIVLSPTSYRCLAIAISILLASL